MGGVAGRRGGGGANPSTLLGDFVASRTLPGVCFCCLKKMVGITRVLEEQKKEGGRGGWAESSEKGEGGGRVGEGGGAGGRRETSRVALSSSPSFRMCSCVLSTCFRTSDRSLFRTFDDLLIDFSVTSVWSSSCYPVGAV